MLPLVLDLCLKMEPAGNQAFLLKYVPDSTDIITFIIKLIEDSTSSLRASMPKDGEIAKSEGFFKHEPALVWMALHCFPHVVASGADHSERAWELAVALEEYVSAYEKGCFLVDIFHFYFVVKYSRYPNDDSLDLSIAQPYATCKSSCTLVVQMHLRSPEKLNIYLF